MAKAFDLCPYFLLPVLLAVAIAEIFAPPASSVAPHLVLLWPIYWAITGLFGALFVATGRPRTRRDWINVVSASLILPLGNAALPFAVQQTIWLYPQIYDARIFALDGTLGTQPSFVMADGFSRFPILAHLCAAFYGTILFPVALVAALEARRGAIGMGLLPTFLIAAAIGYACYGLTPAVGPGAFFGPAFPFDIGLRSFPVRNAMPSMHNAWLMLAFLASRGMSAPVRIMAAVWLAGTVIATLGLGQHYLVDVVVATPLVLLIRSLCGTAQSWSRGEERQAAFIALLLLFAWVLMIRGAISLPDQPGSVPVFMAATVLLVVWCERRMWVPHQSASSGTLISLRA